MRRVAAMKMGISAVVAPKLTAAVAIAWPTSIASATIWAMNASFRVTVMPAMATSPAPISSTAVAAALLDLAVASLGRGAIRDVRD
jgi:hypothetical protein